MSDGDSDDGFVFIEDDLIGRNRPKHRSKPEEKDVVLVSQKPDDGNNVSKKPLVLESNNGEGDSQQFSANQFNLVHDTQSEIAAKRIVAAMELNSSRQSPATPSENDTMSEVKEESLPMENPARDTSDSHTVATNQSKTTEEEDAEYMRVVEAYHQAQLAKFRQKEAEEAFQARDDVSSSSPSRHSSRRSSISSSEIEPVQSDDDAAPVVPEEPEAPIQPTNPVNSSDVSPPGNRVNFLSDLCAAILQSKQYEQVTKKTEEENEAKDNKKSAKTKGNEISEKNEEEVTRVFNENRQDLLEQIHKEQEDYYGAPAVQVKAEEEPNPVKNEEKATTEEDEDEAYMREVEAWHQKELEKSRKQREALSSGTVVSSGETSQIKAKEEKKTTVEDEDEVYMRQVEEWHQRNLEKSRKQREAQEVSNGEASSDSANVQQQNTVMQYTSDELKNLREAAASSDNGTAAPPTQLARSIQVLPPSFLRAERHCQPEKKEVLEGSDDVGCDIKKDSAEQKEIEQLRKKYKQNGGARGYVMTDAERKKVEDLRKKECGRSEANAAPVQMFSQLSLGESASPKVPATASQPQTQYAVQHPDGKVYKIKCDPTPKDDVKPPQPQANQSEQLVFTKKADTPAEPTVKKSHRYDNLTPETNLVPHPEYVGQWTTEEYARSYVKSDNPPPFVTVPPTIANPTKEPLPLRKGSDGVYRPYDPSLEVTKEYPAADTHPTGVVEKDQTQTLTLDAGYYRAAPIHTAYAHPIPPAYTPQQTAPVAPVAVEPKEETPEEAEARRAEEIRKSEELIGLMGMAVVEHDAMIHLLNATNKRQAEQRRLIETGAATRELTEKEVDDLLEGRVKVDTLRNREYNINPYGVSTNSAYPVPAYPSHQSYAPPPVPVHTSTNYPVTTPTTNYTHPRYPSPPAPPQNTYRDPSYPVTHPYMEYAGKNQSQQCPSSSNYQSSSNYSSASNYPSGSNYQSGSSYPSSSNYQQPPSQSGQQYTDSSYRYPALYPSNSQQNYYPQQTSVQSQPTVAQQYVEVEPRSFYPQNAHYTSTPGGSASGYPQPAFQPVTAEVSYGVSRNNTSHYVSPIDDTYRGFNKSNAKPQNHNGYSYQAPAYSYTAPPYPYTAPSYPYSAPPAQTSSCSTPAVYINDNSSREEIRSQMIKFITDHNKSGRKVYLSTFFKPPSVITYNFDVVMFAQMELKDIVNVHPCLTNDVQKEYLFELKN
ncbi:hypothetical protein GCK72_025824 [Caenorhabditis remanei]|uniref:Uncharacterized protein n=1 Tax=Caenorhabditis remanei TaxID=31234 RepID=A0A6A5G351_CAERE|nr:hypothetical protein GCK72_025824 [Caenorhabditis remanei]KAF1749357.1 hypothetical protein GCK72_025824 [Caenorhabditis remanei]